MPTAGLRTRTRPVPALTAIAATTTALALTLAGCGASNKAGSGSSAAGAAEAAHFNTSPDQHRYPTAKVAAIAAEVPAAIRAKGTLDIVDSSDGAAPLDFYATDNKTVIGVEPDIGYAVAQVLGLKPVLHTVAWAQIFVGLDSGRYDAGFANITDTELRKEKYDFATYRKDNVAFEALKDTSWQVHSAKDVAGRTIAVDSGTNQEKLLVEWSAEDVRAGLKPVRIKYYQGNSAVQLALQSGQIDAYLRPNPTARYHVATSGQTKVVGTLSGAGLGLQGLIAATTKKNDGLVKPLNDALDDLMRTGVYGKILKRWDLSTEAVPSSLINPPGLPLDNQ
jgi:polar amino acid transport system substrate-binding protein